MYTHRRLLTLAALTVIALSVALPAFAFPGVPYQAQAGATALSISVETSNLGVGITDLDIVLSDDGSDLAGAAASPVTSNGNGFVASIAGTVLGSGLPNTTAGAVSSTKSFGDASATDSDSDGTSGDVAGLGLLTLGLSSNDTTSALAPDAASPTTISTDTNGAVASATAIVPLSATASLTVSTGAITSSADVNTNTTAPNHDAAGQASAQIDTISIDLNGIDAALPVITASVISGSASASGDGTLGGAQAGTDFQVLDLALDGSTVAASPGVPIDINGLGIATLTVRPVASTTSVAGGSDAQTVALRLDINASLPGADTVDVRIDLGTASASAQAAATTNTGANEVRLRRMVATEQRSALSWLRLFAVFALTLAAGVALRRRPGQ